MSTIAAHVLGLAATTYRVPDAPAVRAFATGDAQGELTASYVSPDRTPAGDLWVEFRAQESAAARAAWLRELLFPSRAYMQRKYGPLALPALLLRYAGRLLGGMRNTPRS